MFDSKYKKGWIHNKLNFVALITHHWSCEMKSTVVLGTVSDDDLIFKTLLYMQIQNDIYLYYYNL